MVLGGSKVGMRMYRDNLVGCGEFCCESPQLVECYLLPSLHFYEAGSSLVTSGI
jgi:hypothetical protein